MADHKIELYGQPGWPPCKQAEEYLSQKGVPFTKYDVTVDDEARNRLIEMGSRATPTLVVNGEVLIGFQKARLDELLS